MGEREGEAPRLGRDADSSRGMGGAERRGGAPLESSAERLARDCASSGRGVQGRGGTGHRGLGSREDLVAELIRMGGLRRTRRSGFGRQSRFGRRRRWKRQRERDRVRLRESEGESVGCEEGKREKKKP